MSHQSDPFCDTGPDAVRPASAGALLGSHYRSLREAVRGSDAAEEGFGQDRRAHEVSVAAAFVLRVLGERSRIARKANGQSAEEIRRMRSALRDLSTESPDLAEVLSLHEIAGLSTDEVASVLGAHPATVERDLRSAKVRIAEILAR